MHHAAAKHILQKMNRLTGIIFFTVLIFCTACGSWHMDEHRNCSYYTGFIRSYDTNERKYIVNKNKRYRLELYSNSNNTFRLSEIGGSRPWKCGNGMWHDCGDYILLEFNDFKQNRMDEKLEESLLGVTFIHGACMMLKKKGKKDLKILPSNAVLKGSF